MNPMQEVFYYLSSAECEDGDVEYLGFKKPTPFANVSGVWGALSRA